MHIYHYLSKTPFDAGLREGYFIAFEVSRKHGFESQFPWAKQENVVGIYGYKLGNIACLFQYGYSKTILLLPEDITIFTHFCKPTVFNGIAQVGLLGVLETTLLLIH